jgi:hypothetical protein
VMDLYFFNPLFLHLGGICVALVLITRVNPPLARLYSMADEATDHS